MVRMIKDREQEYELIREGKVEGLEKEEQLYMEKGKAGLECTYRAH